jgi:ABC-2 type transport system ATP-binding protein
MNNVLEVRGLNKSYGAFSLKDVTFEIPTGYIMGFIGPNGAGKTTTIKAILNMIKYTSGDIRLFGKNGKLEQVNEWLGVTMDLPFYSDDWTARDVESAISPFYHSWESGKYAGLLQRFNIASGKKVKELSRGMKVKLMLAAALAHQARLLILDEPTSGLDPVARDELCELLAEFVTDENRSVLFSTHITSDLEKIADYITFILDGKIVFTGHKDDLLEKYVSVKGGRAELTPDVRKQMLGLREHATGFEGMAEAAGLHRLPKTLLAEPVTLDEIIVYMNKGAKLHE